jgi:hypothetical protein
MQRYDPPRSPDKCCAARRYVSASVLLYLLVRRGMFDPADLFKQPPHNELLSLLAVRMAAATPLAPAAPCTRFKTRS